MEKCWCHAMFLWRFEDVVGDVEGIVEVDSKDAKVEVRKVEGGGGDEDFDWWPVSKGIEGLFVVWRIRGDVTADAASP
jgi:hypothetical protein